MKRTRGWPALRKAHLWLGSATAAWLMLMAATGTVLLFKPQLKALTAPSCAAAPPRPLAEALPAIDRAFSDRVRLVVPASADLCLHEVIFRNAAGGAYVDPATLRPVRVWGHGGRPVDVVLELHRTLLLQDRGKPAIATLAAATLLLVTAGVVLALRRPGALSLRLWPLARQPGALLASHRNLGVLLALPLAFMAASGWAMTYPKTAQGLLAGALGERPAPARPAAAPEVGRAAWRAVLATATSAFPGHEPRVVSWPERPGGAIVVRFRQAGEWSPNGQSAATVAPVSGHLLARKDGLRGGRAAAIWAAIYPLHAGHAPPWIGIPLLVCVAAALLFGAAFPLLAQLQRTAGSRRGLHPHPGPEGGHQRLNGPGWRTRLRLRWRRYAFGPGCWRGGGSRKDRSGTPQGDRPR